MTHKHTGTRSHRHTLTHTGTRSHTQAHAHTGTHTHTPGGVGRLIPFTTVSTISLDVRLGEILNTEMKTFSESAGRLHWQTCCVCVFSLDGVEGALLCVVFGNWSSFSVSFLQHFNITHAFLSHLLKPTHTHTDIFSITGAFHLLVKFLSWANNLCSAAILKPNPQHFFFFIYYVY